jgi:hypothetical protein
MIPAWTIGSVDLLRTAIAQFKEGKEFSRKLALILTDNAIEIMLKTFLRLPEQETGVRVPQEIARRDYWQFNELLDQFGLLAPKSSMG